MELVGGEESGVDILELFYQLIPHHHTLTAWANIHEWKRYAYWSVQEHRMTSLSLQQTQWRWCHVFLANGNGRNIMNTWIL